MLRPQRRWQYMLLAWILFAVQPVLASPVLGDVDQDADVDLVDFARFANCFSGEFLAGPQSCGVFNFSTGLPIGRADFALFTCGFSGPGETIDAVMVDPPASPTSAANVALTGTTAGATQVQVAGGAQTVTVATDGCEFTVQVPLRPNALNRLYVTGLFNGGAVSAPTAVAIAQDSQPPILFVDFPAAAAEITTATTDVAGRVGDALSGFAGLRVKVSINDQPFVPAAVDIGIGSNLTYFLPSVALDVGANTITVRAFDGLENAVEKQIVVTRVDIPAGTPAMSVVSGNAQSAPIHGVPSQPIQVQIISTKGVPMEGKLVNFDVVRSDGRLAESASELLPGTERLQSFTDAQGMARAFWRLGSDAGRGNNRVEVTSDSIVGTTFFCASATPGPATQINIGGGNNQRAEAGAPAPEPLNIWVNDSCNPVSGAAVTFMVRQGGGKIQGSDAFTLDTDSSGHAEVGFTLGPSGGNNTIEATFQGNPNAPAVFNIFGVVRDAETPTSFSGLVLDNAGQPLQGATCALVIGGVTLPFVVSNADGRFRFDDVPSGGPADLHVAGASATHVGGVSVPPNSFPSLRFSIIVVPNAANSLSTPVLLPKLDPANARLYSTTQDTELTVAGMAGLRMIVKAGSMRIRSGGQYVSAPNGTAISLNQVHHDDVPMPLPDGAAPPFAWTVQPGGAQFDPPITVLYPNMSGLPAGAIANFLSFNHDTGKFEIIASGHVTEDATTIETDPGSGISVAGWGCNCPPYSVTGECHHCPDSETAGDDPECCFPDCGPCELCRDGACVFACSQCTHCDDGRCVPNDFPIPCGSTCIPNGSICCAGVQCSSAFTSCCAGRCCTGACCDGSCVEANSGCCGGGRHCPPPDTACCPGRCCPADLSVCCQAECCVPNSLCCPSGCCPPGSRCCGDVGCCLVGRTCCIGPLGVECCAEGQTCNNGLCQ